jgi:4-amino-4-deoxy-L-arabinose transferase-like glycosyltransferase
MRQRGDYVVPFFNNQPRLDKPPLIYWCQVAIYTVFGENDFAARLPSALASMLTALVIFGFGTRLYGRRAGFHAALVFTLCLQVLILSKAAVADMPMVFFVALASWAGWELIALSPHSRFWWWIFYIALALGFLAKGPVAWLPVGTVLMFFAWTRRGGVNRTMKFHVGIPVTLALVALWGVPALLRTNGDFFRIGIGRHVVARSLTAFEGHGAKALPAYLALLPFYFITVFASFFPWSVFLPGMISHFKEARHRDVAEIYLIGGILLTFLIFTPLSTKLPHYTLPAFPLLAILFAGWLGEGKLPAWFTAGMIGLSLVVSFVIAPLSGRFFPVARLACEAAPWLKPETKFASVDFQEPSLVWYFRGHLRGWLEVCASDEIIDFMNRPGPRCCILPTKTASALTPDASWKRVTADGFNLATGKRLELTLWVKEI